LDAQAGASRPKLRGCVNFAIVEVQCFWHPRRRIPTLSTRSMRGRASSKKTQHTDQAAVVIQEAIQIGPAFLARVYGQAARGPPACRLPERVGVLPLEALVGARFLGKQPAVLPRLRSWLVRVCALSGCSSCRSASRFRMSTNVLVVRAGCSSRKAMARSRIQAGKRVEALSERGFERRPRSRPGCTTGDSAAGWKRSPGCGWNTGCCRSWRRSHVKLAPTGLPPAGRRAVH